MPAAASAVKHNAGKPHCCALQGERALANTPFGAGDVAQRQFPASGLARAMQALAARSLWGRGRKRAEDFKAAHRAQIGYG